MQIVDRNGVLRDVTTDDVVKVHEIVDDKIVAVVKGKIYWEHDPEDDMLSCTGGWTQLIDGKIHFVAWDGGKPKNPEDEGPPTIYDQYIQFIDAMTGLDIFRDEDDIFTDDVDYCPGNVR